MKVALISDTHGFLPAIPDGVDAVLHAGDIGVDRDPVRWFSEALYPWARKVGVPIYATFGNHDRIGERLMVPDPIPTNLRFEVDALIDVLGVPVWFSPWSLRFYDWAFMAGEPALRIKYDKIPEKTQVIVSHGPPFGSGDMTLQSERVGSVALLDRMLNLPELKLVVTGHIHEAHGIHRANGMTRVINCTHVNEYYEPVHEPIIIEWPPAR